MKTKLKPHFLLLVALSVAHLVQAQGTAFTYQGRLTDNSVPADGLFDFIFIVYDAEADGNAMGAPVALDAIAVSAGLFVVPLDFGPDIFTGAARWLEIAVQTNGGATFATLIPRQAVSPAPYAVYARSAGGVANGTVAADQLNTGGIAPAPGQFLSYDGGNLFWSDPGVVPGNVWSVLNNNAYYTAGNVGIGTSTPAPGILLDVNGPAILRPGGNGGGVIGFGTPNFETGMTISGNNRADIRFDGSTLKLVAGPAGGPPPSENGIAIDTLGNVGVGRDLLFGERGRQMLNLFGTGYGIGIQTANLYYRSGGGFAWHLGGAHSEATYDSGGGATLMTLDLNGLDFGARLGQHLRLWSDSSRNFGIGIQAGTIYTRTGGGPGDGFAWHKGGVHDGNPRNPGGGKTLMTLDEESGLVVNGIATTKNARQNRDQGGFVKAMAYVNPFLPADQYVVRCYNSQLAGNAADTAPCGITVRRDFTGVYIVDFGFKIDDRFISITPLTDAWRQAFLVRDGFNETRIRVDTFDMALNYEDATFFIFVY